MVSASKTFVTAAAIAATGAAPAAAKRAFLAGNGNPPTATVATRPLHDNKPLHDMAGGVSLDEAVLAFRNGGLKNYKECLPDMSGEFAFATDLMGQLEALVNGEHKKGRYFVNVQGGARMNIKLTCAKGKGELVVDGERMDNPVNYGLPRGSSKDKMSKDKEMAIAMMKELEEVIVQNSNEKQEMLGKMGNSTATIAPEPQTPVATQETPKEKTPKEQKTPEEKIPKEQEAPKSLTLFQKFKALCKALLLYIVGGNQKAYQPPNEQEAPKSLTSQKLLFYIVGGNQKAYQ